METTIVYWDYIGIMENKLESTILLGRVARDLPYLLHVWSPEETIIMPRS